MTATPPVVLEPSASGDRLLPWRKVKDLTGISRTTAWRLQNAGDFPSPVVVSPGRVAWRERDVTAWKETLAPRGARPRSAQAKPPAPEMEARDARPPAPRPTPPMGQAPEPGRPRRRPQRSSNQMSFDF